MWSINGLARFEDAHDPCAFGCRSMLAEGAIQPTVPFYAVSTAAFTSDGSVFEFEYDQDIPLSQILGVWEHAMTAECRR